MASSHLRATRLSAVSADDLISEIDRVSRSIVECIQLGESVLGRLGESDHMPLGLHNNMVTYSNLFRVPRRDLHTSDLAQPNRD